MDEFLNEFEGRVRWAWDGDTLLPAGFGNGRVVRIFGADAPEFGQAWYAEARKKLLEIVRGRVCVFRPVSMDRYGRVVCKVFSGPDVDVSERMLDAGLAWWDVRYAGREVAYGKALERAKEAKRCIWSAPYHGFAPWVWRARKHFT
jgi:micrococcal nuclease